MGRLSYLIAEEANEGRQKDLRAELSRLENTAVGLGQMLKELEERLTEAVRSSQRAAEGIQVPEYTSEFASLREAVASLQASIESIHIPEVPPFPEIPQPEKVDLSPVLDGLSALDIQPVVNVEPVVNIDREPREFEFHVERNSAGLIEKVRVTEHER